MHYNKYVYKLSGDYGDGTLDVIGAVYNIIKDFWYFGIFCTVLKQHCGSGVAFGTIYKIDKFLKILKVYINKFNKVQSTILYSIIYSMLKFLVLGIKNKISGSGVFLGIFW